jgi:hypothetical protein
MGSKSADGEHFALNLGVYKGGMENGKRHGIGILKGNPNSIWSGRSYQGYFNYGACHGRGSHVWSDGSRYDGEWERGNFHGSGTFFSKDRCFAAQWENGHPLSGTMIDASGSAWNIEQFPSRNSFKNLLSFLERGRDAVPPRKAAELLMTPNGRITEGWPPPPPEPAPPPPLSMLARFPSHTTPEQPWSELSQQERSEVMAAAGRQLDWTGVWQREVRLPSYSLRAPLFFPSKVADDNESQMIINEFAPPSRKCVVGIKRISGTAELVVLPHELCPSPSLTPLTPT